MKNNKKLFYYTMCGLDYIYLGNGFVLENDPDYGELVSIKEVDSLHDCIGQFIIKNIPKLTGQEIRFLRSEMRMSQKDLAELFDVKIGSVNRWEQNKVPITIPKDRLLRIIYMDYIKKRTRPLQLINSLKKNANNNMPKKQLYEITENGWQNKAYSSKT